MKSIRHRRISINDTIFWLVSAAVIGVVITALLLVLNFNSFGLGGRARIDEAFASKSLASAYLSGNLVTGKNQFNDCLILGMALDQRASVRELAISPTIPFASESDICAALHDNKAEGRYFYHNYIHGQTTLTRYLIAFMPVVDIRNLYQTTITLLLLVGIGISMLRIASGRAVRDRSVFLIVLLCFARFFGLEMFGQSLGHGPSDAVLIGYIVVAALNVDRWSARRATVAAALFGSVTMIFELLTGGLPLGLAAVFGLSWFAMVPTERSVPAVGRAAAAYLVAATAVAVTKLIAVVAVFGPETLQAIFRSAQQRINGGLDPIYGDRTLLGAMLQNMDALTPGLKPLSVAVLLIALASGCLAIWRYRHRADVLLLGLSNIPVLAWPLVFQQHMMVHAWFMDRIFVWPIASGFALFALSLFYDREDKDRPMTPACRTRT